MAHDDAFTLSRKTLSRLRRIQAGLGVSMLKARQGWSAVFVQDLRTTGEETQKSV
jgi:hypothetical protein